MSVSAVTPEELRTIVVQRSGTQGQERTALAVVEYHGGTRAGLAARAMGKAARWVQRKGDGKLPFLHVDARAHASQLDQLGVRVLPQPTTVAIYWSDGTTQLRRGDLVSSRELVRQLAAA